MASVTTSDRTIKWVGWAMCLRVTRQDAPSTEAWNLLAWCRKRPSNLDAFYSAIFPKVLPMTDSGIEEEAEEIVVTDEQLAEGKAKVKEAAEYGVRQADHRC